MNRLKLKLPKPGNGLWNNPKNKRDPGWNKKPSHLKVIKPQFSPKPSRNLADKKKSYHVYRRNSLIFCSLKLWELLDLNQ